MQIRALWRRAQALAMGVSALLALPAVAVAQPALLDNLREYSTQRMQIEPGPGETLSLRVDLDGELVDITLSPHSVRSGRFVALAPDETGALRPIPAPAPTTYRGTVEGAPESHVAAAVLEGRVEAIVVMDDAQWGIEPLDLHKPGAAPDLHLVYRASDRIEPEGFCAVDDALADHDHDHEAVGGGQDENLICEVAADSDYEFYLSRGSSPASVISGIEQVLNGAELIYERDVEVTFEVTTIIVRDAPIAGYTSTVAETLLNQVAQEWQRSHRTQQRDVAHLFTGRNLSGGTIGIAWLNAICSTGIGYGVDQMAGISVVGRIGLFSHELGHNFSAPHCSGSDCRIMCPGLGGCTGDVSRFGAASKTRIRNYALGRSCLEEEVTAVPLPFADEFPSTTIDGEKWPEASGVQVTFATKPPSLPYGMSVRTDGIARSGKLILEPPATAEDQVWISLWTQHRFTQAGRGVLVEYYSSSAGQWKQLDTILSSGTDQAYFTHHEYRAPFDAYGEEFQLRIRAVGIDSTNLWFVDDVEVNTTCRADLTGDGLLDFFDFLEFQDAFAAGVPQADFTNDGEFDFFDFLAFQNALGAGCD
jgi:hypothetical protein